MIEISEEHRAQVEPWAKKWAAATLRTTPLTEEEKATVSVAVSNMYECANLPRPENVVFVDGPLSAAIVSGIAGGLWHIKKQGVSDDLLESLAIEACKRYCAKAAVAVFNARVDAERYTESVARGVLACIKGPGSDQSVTKVTDEEREEIVKFLFRCCYGHWKGRNGGNNWSGWLAAVTFFRYVVKEELDYSKWDNYEKAGIAGPRYTFPNFAVVSELPTVLRVDDQNRPHCADGPSHEWTDGFKLFYWHGIRVPAKLILEPEQYTAEEVLKDGNSERARALAERMGWDAFMRTMHATQIGPSETIDGLEYSLWELPEGAINRQPRLLKMQSPVLNDGTQPYYVEPVHPDLTTPAAARRWQFPNRDGSYPSVEEANENPEFHFQAEY